MSRLLVAVLLFACAGCSADKALPHYQKGVKALEDEQLEVALASFNDAIAINPQHVDALEKRGDIYWRRGMKRGTTDNQDLKDALADYTQVIRLDPTRARPYLKRGETYNFQSKYELARADLTEVISRSKNEYDLQQAYQERSRCNAQLGNKQDAETDSAKAKELSAKLYK